MTRTIPTPAMPLGSRFDPDASIMDNARAAWDAQQEIRRGQNERNAKTLARRVFRTDDLEFSYDVNTGLDVPTFTIEDELIAYYVGEGGSTFVLIEFCGDCGNETKGRQFSSLADLGRRIAERDEADAFVCQQCRMMAQVRQAKR